MSRQWNTELLKTDAMNYRSESDYYLLVYEDQHCYPVQLCYKLYDNNSMENNITVNENIVVGDNNIKEIVQAKKAQTLTVKKPQTLDLKKVQTLDTTEKLDMHPAVQVLILDITKVLILDITKVQISDITKVQILDITKVQILYTVKRNIMDTEKIQVSDIEKEQTLDTEKVPTLYTEKVQTLDTEKVPTLDTEKVPTLDTEKVQTLHTEKVPALDTEKVPTLDTEKVMTINREKVPTLDTEKVPTLDTEKVLTINREKVPTLYNQYVSVTMLENSLTTISGRDCYAVLHGEFLNLRKEKNMQKTRDNHLFPRESNVQRVIRDNTWLDLSHLPVPKIDLTVAYKEHAQTVVQTPQTQVGDSNNSETIPHNQFNSNQTFEPLLEIMTKIADGNAPGPQVTMRYELLRICTLRNYPKDNKPYLIQLAAAGFYYAAEGDEVICYCCGLRRHSWVATDVPERIHRRINPNCKYLNRKHEFNVPIAYTGTTANLDKLEIFLTMLNEEPVSSRAVTAEGGNDLSEYAPANPSFRGGASTDLGSPKHPQHILKSQRILSFQGWPDNLAHTPEIMAEAGFYYAGFGDCVRCYYCGIGLRHWAQEDNPWIEHARWSKNCAFIKNVKGEEFVDLVQMAVQYSQNEEGNQATGTSEESSEQAAENTPSERELVDKILKSDPAQSVLEMGYQPNMIKKAIEFILKRDGQLGISSHTIMEKVLEYEEAETSTNIVGELANMDLNRHDNPSGETEARSTEKSASKVNESEDKLLGKDKKKPQLDKGNGPKPSEARSIKEENKKLKEQSLCKICIDKPVCIVFLPCGHLCTCDSCAPAIKSCPICKTDVKGTVKTYMS